MIFDFILNNTKQDSKFENKPCGLKTRRKRKWKNKKKKNWRLRCKKALSAFIDSRRYDIPKSPIEKALERLIRREISYEEYQRISDMYKFWVD